MDNTPDFLPRLITPPAPAPTLPPASEEVARENLLADKLPPVLLNLANVVVTIRNLPIPHRAEAARDAVAELDRMFPEALRLDLVFASIVRELRDDLRELF